jgi:hypothetical protein
MKKRKPILLVDDTIESQEARNMLFSNNIDFIEYDIKKFRESCYGYLPTINAPSIFAPEGVYKGKALIEQYITQKC